MQKFLDNQLVRVSERGVNWVVSMLDRGANVNATESWTSGTPLGVAADNGHVECIKALLDRGAEVDKWSCSGGTSGHEECIKALISRNTYVGMKDPYGHTPLHGAAFGGYVECVKALLGRGADVNIKDSKGQSALNIALGLGRHGVVDAIRNHMSLRSVAQQDGDQRPAQNSSGNLQTKNNNSGTQLATAKSRMYEQDAQLAAARSRIDECEEQLTIAKSRNDEHEAQLAAARSRNDEYAEQLATARSRIDECEVHMACMTGQEDVLASQDVETLERLLAKVDKECLRKAIFDKRVMRDLRQALGAAAECGVCLSAPKDTYLDPCGHTICRACSDLIQVCPICRQQIAERKRLFL
eukprot:gene30654-biopygen16494